MDSYSNELFLLLAGCTLLVGLYGYFHSRRYWEGLPPILDAFVSMAGFVAIIGMFVGAGRVGMAWGHPHAARVLGIAITIIFYRAVRTWISK